MAKKKEVDMSMFSPMEATFRAYDVAENEKDIVKMFRMALGGFRDCKQIQIEISAPPRNYDEVIANRKDLDIPSSKTVVKGFAG